MHNTAQREELLEREGRGQTTVVGSLPALFEDDGGTYRTGHPACITTSMDPSMGMGPGMGGGGGGGGDDEDER